MTEALVQWTLINNLDYLATILNFDLSKTIGQEIGTEFGRIDFIVANNKNEHLIVELETTLNTAAKRNYCFTQTLNYKNINFSPNTDYCILYADETNARSKFLIENFASENNVFVRTYSLEATKDLYKQTVNRLSLNVGLALPNPKNYTICYLRWLNKIMKPFIDHNNPNLSSDQIFAPFDNPRKSQTNFRCYERIAMDFELFKVKDARYLITENGKVFIENISPFVYQANNVSSIDLTNEQKRLLLKVLTNGNWEGKVHKVNIYWFLRFIEVTNGSWIPKNKNIEQGKLDIAKGLFNVSYNPQTMYQFLNWCCNYCLELNLIEKVKSLTKYDKIFLTPLGVEVNNIFSLDLNLKKTRMNLSFKYLE